MSQRYPRAVDLAQMPHCSACGETNPLTDDGGDTTCCARRECPGMGPEAQDVCCQALQDRVDHEAVHGTPPSPVTAKPQARPTPARSTRTDETRGLRSVNGRANLMSHRGAPAPTTPAPKEPEMPLSTTATAAPELPASGWAKHYSSDVYHGYAVMAADKGRVWHLSRHNDEAVCSAKVDRYIGLEEAAQLTGICAKCSRHLDRNGAYAPVAAPAPQAPAPAPAPAAAPAPAPKGARAALGPSSADGWELLYDKPKAGAEVARRYTADGKPVFALVCKAHGHVHALDRLSDEGKVRKAGGWCPSC